LIDRFNLNRCWKSFAEFSSGITRTAGQALCRNPNDQETIKEETGTMNVKPLGDKLIVKRADPQQQTDSGIYLPESAKDKPREGEIIATGQGILNHENGEYMPFTVKKGDQVIFTSYSGTEVKIDGDDYLIMTENDILGIIE